MHNSRPVCSWHLVKTDERLGIYFRPFKLDMEPRGAVRKRPESRDHHEGREVACLMPPAISKTHYNCGHPRSKRNSSGSGYPRCRQCKNTRRAQRRLRVIVPLLKEQGNRCAICKRKLSILRKVCQDHNHKHKRCTRIGGGNGPSGCLKCRRGILCASCNGGLTLVENKRLHKAAIQYLKRWETQWIKNNT